VGETSVATGGSAPAQQQSDERLSI